MLIDKEIESFTEYKIKKLFKMQKEEVENHIALF
jgi:hypothetical protein